MSGASRSDGPGLALGISCYFHDAAAVLAQDGVILAAAEEERFSRRKHDPEFPSAAMEYCLSQAPEGAKPDLVVYYENASAKFERTLSAFRQSYPAGLTDFGDAMRRLIPKAAQLGQRVQDAIGKPVEVVAAAHHISHAASAFYPSPFEEAAILVIDGVGEWATTSIGHGKDDDFSLSREIRYPHSLGILYSAVTRYCGFKVNSGEYKLMGLAPFGAPRHVTALRDAFVDLKPDNSFALKVGGSDFLGDGTLLLDALSRTLGRAPRMPESAIDQFYADVAASIQKLTEDMVIGLASEAKRLTGSRRLCLAGGVALNCVANGHLVKAGIFEDIWVQPAAGDAGGALGAALIGAKALGGGRKLSTFGAQKDSAFGPEYSDATINAEIRAFGLEAAEFTPRERTERVAALLAEGKIVGRFQGRMEFGPRALGQRSILADPRRPDAQSRINRAVKFRESWRPFAPAILAEHVSEWFEPPVRNPYMLFVSDVRDNRRLPADSEWDDDIIRQVQKLRSEIPAVTHVDFSARVQSVEREISPDFAALLDAFYRLTDCPMLVNTSFNVRGEPIVCTPGQALRCFLSTDLDALEIGPFLLLKAENEDHAEPEARRSLHAYD